MSGKLIHTEISTKELQSIAEYIKTLHTSGRITAEQRRLFTHAIMAGDSQGNLWTIGAQTGKWYKQTGDKWVHGQPPEKLLLVVPEKDFREAEMQLADFKFELDMKVYQANRCPKCGSEFVAGAHFCIKCGAMLTGTQRPEPLPARQAGKCPGCGQVITGNPTFCTGCGRKIH